MFFLVISTIGAFGVYFLKDLSQEVAQLNTKMAVVITGMNEVQMKNSDHELRLRKLEEKNVRQNGR